MTRQKRVYRLLFALLLCALLCTGCISSAVISQIVDQYDGRSADSEPTEDPSLLDFVVEDSAEPLVLDTCSDSEYSRYIIVYDMDYISAAFGDTRATKSDLIQVVQENSGIPAQFKTLLCNYIERVCSQYPEVSLRTFYENLKTLRVIESTVDELRVASISFDSYGCYVMRENAIYILDDILPEPGTWDYQVLLHEFTHVLRNGKFDYENGEKIIRVLSGGDSLNLLTTDEALTSLFAVSLFDYEERDVAYQLQSNLYSVMLDCCDHYTLADFINHSQSYFAQQLDRQNGHINYAASILKLIEAQYNDYHDNSFCREQAVYYPTYDYIAEMYYRKNIQPGMTPAEAEAVADVLTERVTFDVPEEYQLDTAQFYRYLEQYCTQNSIFPEPDATPAAEETPSLDATPAPAP